MDVTWCVNWNTENMINFWQTVVVISVMQANVFK
jgi:hypothetical protein